MTVRSRFAPSPTGYLHVGGARTALFAWLFAKKHQGQFVLRVEDTDRERSTEASVQVILEGMDWLDLSYDEGPFYQTERLERYQEAIQTLLDKGLAYRCYCSKERLDALREEQLSKKLKPRYDGHCKTHLENDVTKPHVIRFKTPEEGSVVFNDLIRGTIEVKNTELDDLIIARTDGMPTYNLSVVIDDADMQISHVIRGDDHINNTPRQINLYRALELPVPEFAHVPMILGEDGKRLSKRHGAVSVMEFREQGYLADALMNYLVRLGWAHGDQEIFSREEMIEHFDLSAVSRAPAAMNLSKLDWLNQHYIKEGNRDIVLAEFEWHLEQAQIDTTDGPEPGQVFEALQERATTLKAMAESSRYFFEDFDEFEPTAAKKHLRGVALEPLKAMFEVFASQKNWSKASLQQSVNDTAEKLDLKIGKVGMPLRVAVTGAGMSPSLDITLELIGKERVLNRLQAAISFIEQRLKESA